MSPRSISVGKLPGRVNMDDAKNFQCSGGPFLELRGMTLGIEVVYVLWLR